MRASFLAGPGPTGLGAPSRPCWRRHAARRPRCRSHIGYVPEGLLRRSPGSSTNGRLGGRSSASREEGQKPPGILPGRSLHCRLRLRVARRGDALTFPLTGEMKRYFRWRVLSFREREVFFGFLEAPRAFGSREKVPAGMLRGSPAAGLFEENTRLFGVCRGSARLRRLGAMRESVRLSSERTRVRRAAEVQRVVRCGKRPFGPRMWWGEG